jgi:hypothetical protein
MRSSLQLCCKRGRKEDEQQRYKTCMAIYNKDMLVGEGALLVKFLWN